MKNTNETGPVYNVVLIDVLPIGFGMSQAMPSRSDLCAAQRVNERVVAGYELLLESYRDVCRVRDNALNDLRKLSVPRSMSEETQELNNNYRDRLAELLRQSGVDVDVVRAALRGE